MSVISARHRAAHAADELAAAIRALQMRSLGLEEIAEIVGLPVRTLLDVLAAWGLDR